MKRSSYFIIFVAIAVAFTAAVLLPPALNGAFNDGVSEEDMPEIYRALERGYYIERLTDDEEALFRRVYKAVYEGDAGINFSSPVDGDELDKVINVIWADCPELFHFTGYTSSYYEEAPDEIVSVELDYIMDEAEYVRELAATLTALDALKAEYGEKSELEREYAALDYIVDNCAYRDGTEADGTAAGALTGGYARCDGYAYGFALASRYLGLTCLYVSGDAEGRDDVSPGPHAWNVIELEGKFCSLDPTWCDAGDDDAPPYYGFLNLDDATMFMTRSYDDYLPFTPPECTTLEFEPYTMAGLYIKEGELPETAWDEALAEAVKNQADSFSYRLATAKQFVATEKNSDAWADDMIYETGAYIEGYSYIFDPDALTVFVFDMDYGS